jgi:putative methanogenesis marker protein 7
MTVEDYLVFEGGLHKQELLLDFIEDVGGTVIQKSTVGLDLIIFFTIPTEEKPALMAIVDTLKGKIKEARLLGSEIAVVSPTVTRHHTPHPLCDISEYLRANGAKVTIIGLARGTGQRTAQLDKRERDIIDEYDIAIFALGNFEYCLTEKKPVLYRDINIPIIVVGAPNLDSVPYAYGYIGGIGRICHRLKSKTERERLEKLVKVIGDSLKEVRNKMLHDPLPVLPVFVKSEIERQLPEVLNAPSPVPVTLKIDGVRVKVNYDEYFEKIKDVKIYGRKLGEIADIKRSVVKDFILVKILPESITGPVS